MSDNTSPTPATTAEAVGIVWWNRLTRAERRYWLNVAGSTRVVDAFRAYKRRDDDKPLALAIGMEVETYA
jgi:hypothetical protein